jgi:hypothetical protein
MFPYVGVRINCRNFSLGLTTKARGVARVWTKRKPRSHITYYRECRKVWGSEPSHFQGNSHFERWNPGGFLKLQRAISGVKTKWIVAFLYIIGKLLERRCLKWARIAHLDIWNTSYGQKKGRESKSQESTRFTCLQSASDIFLKSSQRELQLCFRPHLNQRFTRKIMGLQNRGSPNLGDFGTPTSESRDKKPFGCGLHAQPQSIL